MTAHQRNAARTKAGRTLRDRRLLRADGWAAIRPADAVELVDAAAEGLGIPFEAEEELRARGAEIAKRVDVTLASRDGTMKELNRRYRQMRLAKAAAGERMQPYQAWISEQKLQFILAAAGISTPSCSKRLNCCVAAK